jgi:plastocyanin
MMLLVGCAKKSNSGSDASSTTSTSKAAEFAVTLDGKTDAFTGEFASFFPSSFSVHPGDSVKFSLPTFSGAPHTITLGTLVDKAVAKLADLGPQALPVTQEETPEMLNLPDPFPHGAPTGPPSPNQSAAQPCSIAGP